MSQCQNILENLTGPCRRVVATYVLYSPPQKGSEGGLEGLARKGCPVAEEDKLALAQCVASPEDREALLNHKYSPPQKPVCDSSRATNFVPATRPIDALKNQYRDGSCERIYYQLFANEDLRAFSDPRLGLPDLDLQKSNSKAVEHFKLAQAALQDMLKNNRTYSGNRAAMNEWVNRISATTFDADAGAGPAMAPPSLIEQEGNP